MQRPLKAGILGATGMVGQRFLQLLENHPKFTVETLGASERSAGLRFEEVCRWKLDTPIPVSVRSKLVQVCDPKYFASCDVIFSGLDSSVATEIEAAFRDADFPVFSNAKNYRMDPQVPLVVPTVNPSHLDILPAQQKACGIRKGYIVTNANCSTTGMVVALKPLHEAFGIAHMHVTTMQAISGAGYPGIPSLDILSNVVPYIGDEEPKIESEPQKILGQLNATKDGFQSATMTIDACCNRVPVIDGHTECLAIKFHRPPPSIEAVKSVLESYVSDAQKLGVVTAPERAIVVATDNDRPQPRLDVMQGRGYSVTVGRLRKGNYWDIQFTILSHNTILGAAGSSIMNAEIAMKKGLLGGAE